MVGVNPDFDYLLDDQQQIPVCFCPVCGNEIYRIGGICLKCEKRSVDDDGE